MLLPMKNLVSVSWSRARPNTPAVISHRRALLLFPEILVESVLRAVRPVIDRQAEGVGLGHVDEIGRDADRIGRFGAPLPCPPAVRVGSVLRGSTRHSSDLAPGNAKCVYPRSPRTLT